MRKILIQLGFIKKNSSDFNISTSECLNAFTKMIESLSKLTVEQMLYRDEIISQQMQLQKELNITNKSILQTEKTTEKIQNILN